MKILITAPSLDENENVSGIAALVRNIVWHGNDEYIHFIAGRKDSDKFGVGWLTSQALLPFSFRRAARRHKPDIIHINTSFEPRAIVRDLVLARMAAFLSIPTVLHIHGGRYVFKDIPSKRIRNFADKLLRSADRIIVLSYAEEISLLKRFPGLLLTVLHNAVAAADIDIAERSPGTKTVIFFGRIHPSKGLDDIVEACRQLVAQGFKFNFVCYGTGPEQAKFTKQMTAVLNDAFSYKGIAKGPDKWAALGSADLFLLPSKFEGLPLGLLEAMATGCVPVASSVGMISEVIDDGHNGFLVEPGNLTQLVGKMKILLSENESSWDEYRRNARETVLSRFDIAGYISKLEKIYGEVISNK